MADTVLAAPTVPPPLNAAQIEAEGALTAVLGGVMFTLRNPVPVGALSVFAYRIQNGKGLDQASAVVRFLRAWVVPEQHDLLDECLEAVADMAAFMEQDVARFVEAGAGRPT